MSARSARAKLPVTLPKREAILQAALEVFAEYGVHGVPVPEIAARAGVGTGTIYRFFVSKEALVNEVFREQKRALSRRLNERLDRGLTPKEAFRDHWRRLVAFAREEPAAFRFLELQDHQQYLDEESRAMEAELVGPIAAACQKLQKRGIFRKDMRVDVLITLHWGVFVNLFKSERSGYLKLSARDLNAACEACWRMFAVTPDD